jgi:hypothetical protein
MYQKLSKRGVGVKKVRALQSLKVTSAELINAFI